MWRICSICSKHLTRKSCHSPAKGPSHEATVRQAVWQHADWLSPVCISEPPRACRSLLSQEGCFYKSEAQVQTPANHLMRHATWNRSPVPVSGHSPSRPEPRRGCAPMGQQGPRMGLRPSPQTWCSGRLYKMSQE